MDVKSVKQGSSENHFSLIQNTIFSLDKNLSLAKNELSIIHEIIEQKKPYLSPIVCASKKLDNCINDLLIIFDLISLLPRIEPCCEFIDEALLQPIYTSLENLNIIIKESQNNSTEIELLQTYIQNLTKEVTYFEKAKSEFRNLVGYIYDKLEWFMIYYRQADWKSKDNFFSKVSYNSRLCAVIQPWVEIAEGKEMPWESALKKSRDALELPNFSFEKRNYV